MTQSFKLRSAKTLAIGHRIHGSRLNLPQKSTKNVGKHTIHGSSLGRIWRSGLRKGASWTFWLPRCASGENFGKLSLEMFWKWGLTSLPILCHLFGMVSSHFPHSELKSDLQRSGSKGGHDLNHLEVGVFVKKNTKKTQQNIKRRSS